MITLEQAYTAYKKRLPASSAGGEEARERSFEEILQQDTGPLYGISHEAFDLKRIWIPDAARSALHILVTGAIGTGKSLVAQEIARLLGVSPSTVKDWMR